MQLLYIFFLFWTNLDYIIVGGELGRILSHKFRKIRWTLLFCDNIIFCSFRLSLHYKYTHKLDILFNVASGLSMRQCTVSKNFSSTQWGGAHRKKSTNYRRENNEQCCGSEMFIPDPDFHPDPGSRVKKAPDPGSGSGQPRISVYLTQKIVIKLSEISGMLIRISEPIFFITDPDPRGSRGQKSTGSWISDPHNWLWGVLP